VRFNSVLYFIYIGLYRSNHRDLGGTRLRS